MNATTPLFYTVKESALRLKVSKSYTYELMKRGRLKFVKLGKRRLLTPAALENLARELEQEAAAQADEGEEAGDD